MDFRNRLALDKLTDGFALLQNTSAVIADTNAFSSHNAGDPE